MHMDQFDHLTTHLSTVSTRRGLLPRLGTLPLAGLLAALLGKASAAGRRKRRQRRPQAQGPCSTGRGQANRCRRHGQCCTGYCHKRKGRCRCKQRGASCTEDRNCCARLGQPMTCQQGTCQTVSPVPPPPPPPPTPPPPPPPSCTGLKPADDLQAAIAAAAPGATLTLCPGTWALSSQLRIAKNLTLVGAGAGQSLLDGGRQSNGTGGVRVLQIAAGARVTLRDLTITKGHAAGSSFPVSFGGGILNFGTLTLRDVAVSGNAAGVSGGGIFNFNGGTLTLQAGSSLTGNTAGGNTANHFGGGIFNSMDGTVTLQAGSSVTGNTAERDGGGGIFNNTRHRDAGVGQQRDGQHGEPGWRGDLQRRRPVDAAVRQQRDG